MQIFFELFSPLSKYGYPDNFFFVDPPYIHGYSYGMDFDHGKLKSILDGIKGQRLFTMDDCPDALKLFKKYRIKDATSQKGIERRHGNMDYKELLIMNY